VHDKYLAQIDAHASLDAASDESVNGIDRPLLKLLDPQNLGFIVAYLGGSHCLAHRGRGPCDRIRAQIDNFFHNY